MSTAALVSLAVMLIAVVIASRGRSNGQSAVVLLCGCVGWLLLFGNQLVRG